jgi:Rrf2 family protein
MISQTAEYALRAVVWLASHPEGPQSTPRIAQSARVPSGYLPKVIQMLARAGLVVSSPGRGGGIRLTRTPEEISVLDVVDAVDPIPRILECPLGLKSHGRTLCPLHRRLDEAAMQVREALAQSSIAELVSEETDSPPLCES